MPTQQTNVTSESGCDAARPRLAIALATDTTSDALTEARSDARVAAPRNAASKKEAVGPLLASMRSVLSSLLECWHAFRQWRQRERFRVRLQNLSDRELMDIGLTANDIDYIVAERAIEKMRDGTAYLWPSRDMM